MVAYAVPSMPKHIEPSPSRDAALLQGTLDLLILRIVALEPLHGYGIVRASSKCQARHFKSGKARCIPLCTAWNTAVCSPPIGKQTSPVRRPSTTGSPKRAAKRSKRRPKAGNVCAPRLTLSSKAICRGRKEV
jgi:hypothetical protein